MSLTKYYADSAKNYIDSLVKEITELRAILDAKNSEFGVFRPIDASQIDTTIYITASSDARLSDDNYNRWTALNTEDRINQYLVKLGDIHAKNCQIAAENEKVGAANVALREKLAQLLIDCGVKATTVVKKGRKYVIVKAAWLNNLYDDTPKLPWPVSTLSDRYNVTMKLLQVQREKIKARAERERLDQEKETNKQLSVARLVLACNKLGIEYRPQSAIQDIMVRLVIDKYIKLSYYMYRARNDFSEIESVFYAWEQFKANTGNDIDQEISIEIGTILADNPDDGRVFRDCKWNYSKILELAEPSLTEIYTELLNKGDI